MMCLPSSTLPLPLLLAIPDSSSYLALPLKRFEVDCEQYLLPSYEGALDGPISFQCIESNVEGSEVVRYAQPLRVIH
jgi:hypothetical protein